MFEKIKIKFYQLLRKSEKYTKTDMVYLFKGGFWLTLGQVSSSFSSFLLAIAFANLIPKETYGNYKYILSIIGILNISTLPGINTSLIRSVAKGYEGSILLAVKTKIKWGALGALVSLFLGAYYYFNNNTNIALSLLIASMFLPFFDTFNLYGPYLQGKKLFENYTKYFISVRIGAIFLIIASLFFFKNLFFIVLIYFIAWTFFRYLIFKRIIKKFPPNKKKDKTTIDYGKKLTWANVIGNIAMQIDKILIFHYLGGTELAIYSFSIIPTEQIKGLLKNIQSLALPKFSKNNLQEIKKTIFPKLFKFSLFIVLIIIIYILLAPFLFKLFFPQYKNSIIYSQVFSVSLLAVPLLLIISVFQAQKMTKTIYIFRTSSAIIEISLLFLMINFFGLWGAIFSKIIIRFFNLLLSTFLLKKAN